MDPRKVEAITDWEELTVVQEVKSFLVWENYYHRFMEGYSKIVAPLTDLLKKNRLWNWMNKCREAFYELKYRLASTSVLKLPDFEGTFEVQIYASDFAINGVLTQDGHPNAYESRKL